MTKLFEEVVADVAALYPSGEGRLAQLELRPSRMPRRKGDERAGRDHHGV